MDYDPEVYEKGAADVVGPIQQLIDILQRHLASPLDETVDENGYVSRASIQAFLSNCHLCFP